MIASDGGVFALGDATFYGSATGSGLKTPFIGLVLTPGGLGYDVVNETGSAEPFGS